MKLSSGLKVSQHGEAAGGGEQLARSGLVDLANQPRKAGVLVFGHGLKHRPEFRLQRQGGGMAGKIDRAFAKRAQ